jgi:hypothetical protein
MTAQAVSALVQASEIPSPTQFGISSAQASQLGLTISSGLTPAFWIYCGFLVALIVSCAWMLFTPPPAPAPVLPGGADGHGWDAAPRDDLAAEEPGESTAAARPDLETEPSPTAAGAHERDSGAG